MYRKFLNARSPLRLLEKGLHGGLGMAFTYVWRSMRAAPL